MAHAIIVRYLLIVFIVIAFPALAAQPAHQPVRHANDGTSTSPPSKPKPKKKKPENKRRKPIIQYQFDVVPPNEVVKPEKPKKLYKFIVHGQRLSPICNLEMIKLALKRPFTIDPAHDDDIVCRIVTLTGTHIKANAHLFCQRMGMILKHQQQFSTTGTGLSSRVLQMDLKLPKVNRGKLRATLERLPRNLSHTCFGLK